MGKGIKYLIVLIILVVPGGIARAQTVSIPDPNFRQFLITYYNHLMTPQGELIIANAAAQSGDFYCGNANIESLEGIQYFTNLSALLCFQNKLTTLPDISNLKKLVRLECFENQITTLPSLSPLTNLQILHAAENKISAFPQMDGLTSLKEIYLYRNDLTSVPDLTHLVSLQKLQIFENKITYIGKMPASLKDLNCGENQLTQIPDISLATGLTILAVYTNRLTTIPDLTAYSSLVHLNLGTNQLKTAPDFISTLTNLNHLTLDNNGFTSIPDLSNLTQLTTCRFENNFLTFQDIQPSSDNPHFSSWLIAPQDSFSVTRIYKAQQKEKLSIDLNVDEAIPGLTFSWYQNGVLKMQTSQPVLDIPFLQKSDNGIYYCRISSSDPLFASLTVVSQSFTITVQPDFRFEEELTLTPDGDGKNDEMLIEEKGLLKVYDSSGNILDQQPSPCYFNGTVKGGKELGTGFYILRVNNDATYGITIVR